MELASLKKELDQLKWSLYGLPLKDQIGEKNNPTVQSRLFDISRVVSGSTYGPTKSARENLRIVQKTLMDGSENLKTIQSELLLKGDNITSQTGIPLLKDF
jgi:hypothetical protein